MMGRPGDGNTLINRLSADIRLRENLTLEQVRGGHKKRNWVPLMEGEEVIEYPADQDTLTKRYTEKAIEFIKANRDRPFFLYLPHTMVHRPLAVSEDFKSRHEHIIHSAIEEVDWSVGEIANTLRELDLAENTLLIFTSDNGAAVGTSKPLRAKKASVYDGGIREPTVMWWPGKIPAGTVCTEVAATIDILPTLAGLAGVPLPERKIDGKDIWPLMSGKADAKSPHAAYCLMHGPGTVRSGKWKYYPWQEGKGGRREGKTKNPSKEPVQLYDTVADIGETTNLAAQHPEVVSRLQRTWEAHVKELTAHTRPTAEMVRPEKAVPPTRPGSVKKKKK